MPIPRAIREGLTVTPSVLTHVVVVPAHSLRHEMMALLHPLDSLNAQHWSCALQHLSAQESAVAEAVQVASVW